jgi:hypothetical protein
LGAALAFALAGCTGPAPPSQGGGESAGCDGLKASRNVAFTEARARDTIETTALGRDCAQAVVVWTLRSEAGEALKVYAAPYAELAGVQDSAAPAGVQMFLERWAATGVDDTSASPPWPIEATFLPDEAGAGMTTQFLRETYEAIRAAKLRRLCVPTGSERFSCLFYDPDAKVVDVHFTGGAK